MSEIAPVTNRGRDDGTLLSPALLTAKWTMLWRSLALSTIGGTAQAYSRFLRVLDLGDLDYLFDDSQFAGKLLKQFFQDLKPICDEAPANGNKRYWNRKAAIQSIGNIITQQAPLVQELDGNLDAEVLSQWIPRLKKLTRLKLWNGAALENLGGILQSECPNFSVVEFYHWSDVPIDADEPFSAFIQDLRPQSLQSLQVIGRSTFGALTFGALGSSQGKSLTELILNDLPAGGIEELHLLKDCTSIRILQLSEDRRVTDLERTHQGVFEEVIEWLGNCKQLTSVKFSKFLSGAAILTPLFLGGRIALTELELRHYKSWTAMPLYESLASQAETLRDLTLQCEPEDSRPAVDAITMGVSRLRRLVYLDLKNTSDFFLDGDIITLASSLRQLEDFSISGMPISDNILESLAGLHSLKRIEISAISEFTFDGLMNWIQQLGPGNEGLSIGISMVSPMRGISEDEQQSLRQMLSAKVAGRFDYSLARDPEAVEEFSDSGDSD